MYSAHTAIAKLNIDVAVYLWINDRLSYEDKSLFKKKKKEKYTPIISQYWETNRIN